MEMLFNLVTSMVTKNSGFLRLLNEMRCLVKKLAVLKLVSSTDVLEKCFLDSWAQTDPTYLVLNCENKLVDKLASVYTIPIFLY